MTNLCYPLAQLARQLVGPPDPKRRDRTAEWTSVLEGILSGAVQVGSRRPTEAPAWVTLEVLHGGFASGNYLAALEPDARPNSDFLQPEGARELERLLDSGKYRIQVPEHAALLVVVHLLRTGEVEAAERIVDQIAPWFDRLRFYPYEADTSVDVTPLASVATAGDVVRTMGEKLEELSAPLSGGTRRKMALERSVAWLQIKWRLVRMFSRTCECEHVGSSAHPECPKHTERGCGWPCQQYPKDWAANATKLLADHDDLVASEDAELAAWRARYRYSTVEPLNANRRKRGTTSELVGYMRRVVTDPRSLSGRDVSRIRGLLAGAHAKHGLPHTQKFKDWSAGVCAQIPQLADTRARYETLRARLARHNEGGLSPVALEEVLAPHEQLGEFPASFRAQVARARLGTLPELLELGLVGSSEVLAEIAAPLSAAAVGPDDPTTARLHYALALAFMARRSLLLTNLEHQVTIDELPWALSLRRTAQGSAREVLELLVVAALKHFPQTILPNKLLQRLRELAAEARVAVCLVDEIAADIFERRFSPKFASAARVARTVLRGTLYETYYQLADHWQSAGESPVALMNVCRERALGAWVNGCILEEEQILTSHSLAGLYDALGLASRLNGGDLALDVWRWVLNELASMPEDYHARLLAVKNIGYAWRQLVFFLSTVSPARADDAVSAMLPDPFEGAKAEAVETLLLSPLRQALGRSAPSYSLRGWVAAGQHPLWAHF
jgi:hypothetical protein